MWQRFWQAILILGLGASGAIASEPSPNVSGILEGERSAATDIAVPLVSPAVVSVPILAETTLGFPLVDVRPDHWAASAVTNLIDNYSCLAGYPDGTFRGDELVTRYEFAAAMDACLASLLNQIEQTRQTEQIELTELMNNLEALEAELGSLSEDVDTLE
ncbi:MAG: S-layer homology domain-containing protein [Cyanobacteria bacterium J06638_20]